MALSSPWSIQHQCERLNAASVGCMGCGARLPLEDDAGNGLHLGLRGDTARGAISDGPAQQASKQTSKQINTQLQTFKHNLPFLERPCISNQFVEA